MKKDWQKLFAKEKELLLAAKTLLAEGGDMKEVLGLQAKAAEIKVRAEAMQAMDTRLDEIGEPIRDVSLPMDADPPVPGANTDAEAMIKAVNILRFGEQDGPTSLVMREIYGGDYRQKMFDQERAFARWMRTTIADPILRKQYWSSADVKGMLQAGLTVGEIKATMVEGQDTLGGHAVPPQRTGVVLAALPGLTAVRGGGALVVQTASNMIEWLKLTGASSDGRYPTTMRGLWGTEVQSPTEDDFTIGLEQIAVNTYTYKVSFSQSLIEDASNLLNIFFNLVTDTLAMDEDDAFLIGDGAGKPRGILPSATNTDSLTEVVSGKTSTLDVATVKGLRRGIQSQYRIPGRASWIGNSDTADDLEQMQDGVGRFYFEYLDEGERFMRSPWRESEAMPDVSAQLYPLLFCDLSGYAIVERLGLSVVRFQDSNTGINKVEFQIRRRIGGRVIEPWKFAVQKVGTS